MYIIVIWMELLMILCQTYDYMSLAVWKEEGAFTPVLVQHFLQKLVKY